MADERTFGSILIQELDKLFDVKHEKEIMTLRESHDVSQFLKEKENWEKKSAEAQILFK